jgi:hypothetical protein
MTDSPNFMLILPLIYKKILGGIWVVDPRDGLCVPGQMLNNGHTRENVKVSGKNHGCWMTTARRARARLK